jgi:hypothetical protein
MIVILNEAIDCLGKLLTKTGFLKKGPRFQPPSHFDGDHISAFRISEVLPL